MKPKHIVLWGTAKPYLSEEALKKIMKEIEKRKAVSDMARYKEFWYNSWRSMMSRCYNEKSANYKYYGGIGITVCAEWHNANNFAEWAISSGWFNGASLDRIDNSKGYLPDNCRWATKKEQAYNRRSTRFITRNGETHNITEWAEILGVDRKLLIDRLYRGWSEQEIFDTNKYSNQYERRKVCDM